MKTNHSKLTVIIPTYNEAERLPLLLQSLQQQNFENVVVVDAESTDNTRKIATEFGASLCTSTQKSRAVQLNLGAAKAKTEWLLFLHADVRLSKSFEKLVLNQIDSSNFEFGNFRLRFDSEHWFLRFNQKFSHFKGAAFQFGDQGLLVSKRVFEKIGGYNEQLLFMEGNEIIERLRTAFSFTKINEPLLVSARKYQEVGVYKLQLSYYLIYFLAKNGIPQRRIKAWFRGVFS